MKQPDLTVVCQRRNTLGEGPVWDAHEGYLYWTDIQKGHYLRLEPRSGTCETFDVGTPVGAIGLREGGGLILATKRGLAFHKPGQGTNLDIIHNPLSDHPDERFNDGAAGPDGSYWAGSYGLKSNTLHRLKNKKVEKVDTGFGIPNGIGWSLDHRTMYFTDSTARTIYTYDHDPATGEVENRRPLIHKPEKKGVPDGLTVDAEGFIWSAWWDGWRLERYDPMGKLERVIPLPVARPTSMAFGGETLDELYVTSATVGYDEEALRTQPLAGQLFRFSPGLRGQEEFRVP